MRTPTVYEMPFPKRMQTVVGALWLSSAVGFSFRYGWRGWKSRRF